MDADQIRNEMTLTRASIDRKLDQLAVRTAAAKQEAIRRSVAGLFMTVAAVLVIWWWRH